MIVLVIVGILFFAAIASAWLIPNSKISDHKEDHV